MNKTSVTHNSALAKASRAVFKVTLLCVPYKGAGQNGLDAAAVDTWNGLPSVGLYDHTKEKWGKSSCND